MMAERSADCMWCFSERSLSQLFSRPDQIGRDAPGDSDIDEQFGAFAAGAGGSVGRASERKEPNKLL